MRGLQWAVTRHPVQTHGKTRYVCELAATEGCTWLVDSADPGYSERPDICPDHNVPINVRELV